MEFVNSQRLDAPFLVLGVRSFDEDAVASAIELGHKASASYDPVSQIADVPLEAGSERTFSDTFSGFIKSRDDDRASDT